MDNEISDLPEVPKVHLPDGDILIGADYSSNLGPRVVLAMGLFSLGIPADQVDLLCAYLKARKNQALQMQRNIRQWELTYETKKEV